MKKNVRYCRFFTCLLVLALIFVIVSLVGKILRMEQLSLVLHARLMYSSSDVSTKNYLVLIQGDFNTGKTDVIFSNFLSFKRISISRIKTYQHKQIVFYLWCIWLFPSGKEIHDLERSIYHRQNVEYTFIVS